MTFYCLILKLPKLNQAIYADTFDNYLSKNDNQEKK